MSTLPRVNDSDLVETLPGARPGCTGSQRDRFERNCETLWEDEKQAEFEDKRERNKMQQLAVDEKIGDLVHMFPLLDRVLISTLYLESSTEEECINQLMLLHSEAEKNGTGKNGTHHIPNGKETASLSSFVEKEGDSIPQHLLTEEDEFVDIVEMEKDIEEQKRIEEQIRQEQDRRLKNIAASKPPEQDDFNAFPILRDQEGWQIPAPEREKRADATHEEWRNIVLKNLDEQQENSKVEEYSPDSEAPGEMRIANACAPTLHHGDGGVHAIEEEEDFDEEGSSKDVDDYFLRQSIGEKRGKNIEMKKRKRGVVGSVGEVPEEGQEELRSMESLVYTRDSMREE